MVVTHVRPLVRVLEAVDPEATTLELAKELGATVLAGQDLLDRPAWHRPKR